LGNSLAPDNGSLIFAVSPKSNFERILKNVYSYPVEFNSHNHFTALTSFIETKTNYSMKQILLSLFLLIVGVTAYAQPTTYPASAGVGGNATNSYYGDQAGLANTGSANTFVGAQSGFSNTLAAGNTFLGYRSGYFNTAPANTFIGRQAGEFNTTGEGLIFIGPFAGNQNTTGFSNTFIGFSCGNSNLAGANNTFVGYHSGVNNVNGHASTFLGVRSGFNATGSSNTFLGFSSGYGTTTGGDNTYVGHTSGYSNTTGIRNTQVGRASGMDNVNGNNNTLLGYGTGQSNVSGSGNVFLGAFAGQSETGSNLLYISNSSTNNPLIWGNFAGNGTVNLKGMVSINLDPNGGVGSPTANLDVNGNARIRVINQDDLQTRFMVADSSGHIFWRDASSLAGDNLGNHIATDNIVPSDDERFDLGSLENSFNHLFMDGSVFFDHDEFIHNRGDNNIGIGHGSLGLSDPGVANIGIGTNALALTFAGDNNVAIGMGALDLNSSGSGNTAIGHNSGVNFESLNNTTAIGNEARTTSDNQVHIGNSSVTYIGGYVDWSVISDGRFKKNIQEDVSGLSFIEKLRPVTYDLEEQKLRRFLKEDEVRNPGKPRQLGFIAQEVEIAAKESGATFPGVQKPRSEAEHYTLQYSQFVVPLTKAVQELSAMVKDQQKQIASLQKMLAESKSTLSADPNTVSLREGFSLEQNHPNPFNATTTIDLTLPDAIKNAFVIIHDLRGMEMKRIPVKERGATSVMLEANELKSGMYLYSLVADGQLIDTKRMLLMD
jgi:trimeric autotransporter adhesin